jgi:hypothetical protein
MAVGPPTCKALWGSSWDLPSATQTGKEQAEARQGEFEGAQRTLLTLNALRQHQSHTACGPDS